MGAIINNHVTKSDQTITPDDQWASFTVTFFYCALVACVILVFDETYQSSKQGACTLRS